jgi:putative flippase GtrA
MLGLVRARLTLEQRRFVKFCVVGASGVVVNLAFVWLGQSLFSELEPKQRDLVASLLGILVSVFGNFLLNNQWTWRDRTKGADPRDLWRSSSSRRRACSMALVGTSSSARRLGSYSARP